MILFYSLLAASGLLAGAVSGYVALLDRNGTGASARRDREHRARMVRNDPRLLVDYKPNLRVVRGGKS